MPIPRVLHTSTFRLSILFAAFFCVSAVLLLSVVYWGVGRVLIDQTDEHIDSDVAAFEKAFAVGGRQAVESLIAVKIGNDTSQTATYQLFSSDGSMRTGNLRPVLRLNTFPELGRGEVTSEPLPEAHNREPHTIRTRTVKLSDGGRLLVGRDIYTPLEITERIGQIVGLGLFASIILAGIGGWMISRALLRRVDGMARVSRGIMEGHLDRRLPVGRANDEFDHLTSQLNAMLDRIETLMADVRQVTSGIAHDLRSPLTRLRMRLEKAQLERGENADPVLEEVIVEVDGIRATFDALLRIAQVDARDPRSNFDVVDLEHLVQRMTELYRTVAEDKGLTWRVNIDGDLLIYADEQLLAQGLSNLIDNALKYTPAGGRISLQVSGETDRARLAIEDTGPGIPTAARQEVLKPFFRLEESRSTPGSGLGLALVAAVAKLHGAELLLADAAPGLRVTLILPRGDISPPVPPVRF